MAKAAAAAGISLAWVEPVVQATKEFLAPISAAAAGMDLFSAKTEAANAKQESLVLGLGLAQSGLQEAAANFNRASQSGEGYYEALNQLEGAQKKVDAAEKALGVSQEQVNKAFAGAPAIAPMFDATAKAAQTALEALKGFEPALAGPLKPAQTLEEAFKALHLTVLDAEGDVGGKLVQAFDTVATSGKATAQQIDAAWGAVSGQVTKLAKTDLPEAIKQQQLYVSALEATDAPLNKQLTAEATLLKTEISLAQERGTSADAYMVQLANINERTTILNATTNILGRTYTSLMADVNKSFTAVAGDISKLIVEGGKFSAVWHEIWTQFAEDILTTVITAIEQWVLKLILGSAVGKAAASALDVGQVIGQAGVAGAAGFASVMADVPFPLNVALAPAVGAAAAATVIGSFVPLASFATGIDYVPYDIIAQIHQGEAIIPASQNNTSNNNPVSVTIIVQADRNPAETARQLARHLKTLSPVFSPLGAG